MKARFAVDSNENAKFDAAIIDDEKLSKHFHDGGARNVPPAVRDKKELSEIRRKNVYQRSY